MGLESGQNPKLSLALEMGYFRRTVFLKFQRLHNSERWFKGQNVFLGRKNRDRNKSEIEIWTLKSESESFICARMTISTFLQTFSWNDADILTLAVNKVKFEFTDK